MPVDAAMKNIHQIRTLGELKNTGYQPRSVKEELRANLIEKIRTKETIFPGIYGFDDTVLPDVERAVLSRHNILLLGLRGQAKTRIARLLALAAETGLAVDFVETGRRVELAPEAQTAIYRAIQEGITNTLKYEMMMALAHLYTSSNHKEFLDYMVDGIPFDWNEFDKSWDGDPGVEKINQLLNKAISSK